MGDGAAVIGLVLYFVLWLGSAAATAVVAHARGRNMLGWLLLGLTFGFLALIVIGLLPARGGPRAEPGACPMCGQPIPEGATGCPQCGELLR
jgi:hypothetical protein